MSTAADHAGFTIQTYVASFSALVCIVVGFLFFIRSYIQDGVSTAEIYRTNLRMAMLRVRRRASARAARAARCTLAPPGLATAARYGALSPRPKCGAGACVPRVPRKRGLAGVCVQASVGTTQTLLTLGTYEDFLNVYRKPLMSSVADLQAMIYMQVRTCTAARCVLRVARRCRAGKQVHACRRMRVRANGAHVARWRTRTPRVRAPPLHAPHPHPAPPRRPPRSPSSSCGSRGAMRAPAAARTSCWRLRQARQRAAQPPAALMARTPPPPSPACLTAGRLWTRAARRRGTRCATSTRGTCACLATRSPTSSRGWRCAACSGSSCAPTTRPTRSCTC